MNYRVVADDETVYEGPEFEDAKRIFMQESKKGSGTIMYGNETVVAMANTGRGHA